MKPFAIRYMPFLVSFHVITIVLANYLTQFPATIFGLHTTFGALCFPFIFLATDLTIRLFGDKPARSVIFKVSIPVVFISYVVSSLFYNGQWQGLTTLGEINPLVLRIALASFAAYAVGQLTDIAVFNRLRKRCVWWAAPAASMTLGNLIDSLIFFSVAFYKSSDPFLATVWLDMALFDTVIKAGLSLVFLLPTYGMVVKSLTSKVKGAANAA